MRTTDERSYATLKYEHTFPQVVDVTAQVYYDKSQLEIGYPFGTALFREQDVGEWWGAELQLTKRLWDRHTITFGGEYRDDFRQDRQTSASVHANRQSYGIYVQGDFQVLTNLHLNAGGRYDQYGDFNPSANPRLALIYNPLAQSTFKAIYGTAFRVPNFLELSDPLFQDIKPEQITAYELVYEQGIGKHLRSSMSGFYNQMDDLIVLESGRFHNLNAEAKGMELALEGIWTNGIRGRISYTLQETRNLSSDLKLPDSPEHLLKFNLSVPLVKEKIFAGLEFQYTSGRLSLHNTTDADGQPLTVQGQEAPGFGIVNFTLFSQNLIKNLEFSASVYNLLDRKYSDPASRFHQQDILERDGRSFRLKLTYRF